jgi:integrase
MNLREHESSDGMKVWLSEGDTETLLDAAGNTEQRIAFALGARCGLRSHEILEVSPNDIVSSDAGRMLKVEHGKGDKYRETPIPAELVRQIETVDDMRDESSDTPVISVTTTQSLRNWIQSTREDLAEQTDDDRWNHLSLHDLRRTWATALASKDVDPLIVCDWGGWNDLETFLEHYKGVYSPEAQRRERDKVSWL